MFWSDLIRSDQIRSDLIRSDQILIIPVSAKKNGAAKKKKSEKNTKNPNFGIVLIVVKNDLIR